MWHVCLVPVSRDKEILAHYIKSVEGALEEAKKKLVFPKDGSSSTEATITMSKLLLNADLIPSDIGKAGPELIACQVVNACDYHPCGKCLCLLSM